MKFKTTYTNNTQTWTVEGEFDSLEEAQERAAKFRRSEARRGQWVRVDSVVAVVDLIDREEKLTDAEFDALERNADGRIIDDFDLAWVWMTDAQKERLHSDDWARGGDVDEELRYLMAEFA